MVHNKRILVTGAGGSIGSQSCSHILEYDSASLVMVDIGENYLYNLKMELGLTSKSAATHYIFGSVTDTQKMDSVFSKFQPQLLFHAAAHKHVPVMEDNIDQAITNNIFETKVIADLSHTYKSEKFVLVSTDKVVHPSSIMGMTKHLAEKYIRFISQQSGTQFMTVRFGNVLGSNGSVVPLFESQIARGAPVTITHPDMERFFMLIPEAVQLILSAGAIGKGGEIFLLNMGKPVKIVDLAKKMITLAGYTPETEIKIEYTGVRSGEKLTEELIGSNERVVPTNHEKINLIQSEVFSDTKFVIQLEKFCQNVKNMVPDELRSELQGMVSDTSKTSDK